MVVLIVGVVGFFMRRAWTPDESEPTVTAEATEEQVREFCAACHAFPSPGMAPRSVWKDHVEQGFRFYHESKRELHPPSADSVVAYYEKRAPLKLPPGSYVLRAWHPKRGEFKRRVDVPRHGDVRLELRF